MIPLIHKHVITNFTGEDFQLLVRRLVIEEWSSCFVHKFVIKKKVIFTIKVSTKQEKIKFRNKLIPLAKHVNPLEEMQTLLDGKLADLPDNQTFRANISMTVKCELPIDITDFTGQQLQEFLLRLVKKEWLSGCKRKFLINKNIFFIEVRPTDDEPGNGIVTFPNTNLFSSWKKLAVVLKEFSFREIRKNFLQNKLKTLHFNERFAVNVLLLFEIVRREPSVDSYPNPYPVSRGQTIEAINKVMNSSAYDYENQVTII